MASGKKPWRYYVVLAFPYAQGIPREQLSLILEKTDAIEAKEENYLQKVASRNQQPDPPLPPSPLPLYCASLLRVISLLGVLGVMAMACGLYRVRFHSDIGPTLSPMAYYVTLGILGGLLLLQVGIWWFVATKLSRPSANYLIFLLSLVFTTLILFIIEMELVVVSQRTLLEALKSPITKFTPSKRTLVLNGNQVPSFSTRFLVDGPAAFLTWLQAHCGNNEHDDLDVDQSDFFAPMWKPKTKKCVQMTLDGFLTMETPAAVILSVLMAVMMSQLVLLATFQWLSASDKPKKTRRKRQSAAADGGNLMLSLVSFLIGVAGMLLVVLGLVLVQTCAFAPTINWYLWGGLVGFGSLVVINALGASCRWQPLWIAMVSVSILSFLWWVHAQSMALEVGTNKRLVSQVYQRVQNQTCPPVVRWMAHTCVSDQQNHTMAKNSTCETEFSQLLSTSLAVSDDLVLSLSGLELLMLLLVLLPFLLQLVLRGFQWICRSTPASNQLMVSPVSSASQWTFQEAVALYLTSLKTTEPSVLEKEARAFADEYAQMTGRQSSEVHDSLVVFDAQVHAIVRTLVLRRLSQNCLLDLSLSVSRDGKWIFAQVFASDNLLMTTLCQQNDVTLQLTDAVDPGPTFWQQKKEMKADLTVMDTYTIKQKLKALMAQQVISAKEAQVFGTESLVKASARVNVLLRASRMLEGSLQVPINRHPPFASYRPHSHLQYLFKKYPNQLDPPIAPTALTRRSSVLRTIDAIRLTLSILQSELDLDRMVKNQLIGNYTPLHAASRYDLNPPSRDTLFTQWVTFWKPLRLRGEPDPAKYWIFNRLVRLYPFRQPIQAVRDYFGESIAFYFAWAGFYGQCLMIPALVAVVLLFGRSLSDPQVAQPMVLSYAFYANGTMTEHPPLPDHAIVFGAQIVLFGFLFTKLWERRSVWYQLEWGVYHLEVEMTDRVNFRGELRRNPVTQMMELHFSAAKRLQRQLMATLLLLSLMVVNLVVVVVMLLSQAYVVQLVGLRCGLLMGYVVLAFVMQWYSDIISIVAHELSEWENYQNDQEFHRAVIVKVVLLQLVNAYGPLWLLASGSLGPLVRQTTSLLDGMVASYEKQQIASLSPLVHLNTLLILIFVVRILSHIISLIQNQLRRNENSLKRPSIEDELALETYGGAYEDYSELVLQFGYVVMFSSVCPLLPVLALVECLLELRLDAIHLCLCTQRPRPETANGIGDWATALRLLWQLGIVVNVGLVLLMNYKNQSLVVQISLFLGIVLSLLLLTQVLWALWPAESRSAQEAVLRNEFVVQRYFGCEKTSGQLIDSNPPNLLGETEEDDEDKDEDDDPIASYHERYELLQRLNVVLRKEDDLVDVPPPPPPQPVEKSQKEPTSLKAQNEQHDREQQGRRFQKFQKGQDDRQDHDQKHQKDQKDHQETRSMAESATGLMSIDEADEQDERIITTPTTSVPFMATKPTSSRRSMHRNESIPRSSQPQTSCFGGNDSETSVYEVTGDDPFVRETKKPKDPSDRQASKEELMLLMRQNVLQASQDPPQSSSSSSSSSVIEERRPSKRRSSLSQLLASTFKSPRGSQSEAKEQAAEEEDFNMSASDLPVSVARSQPTTAASVPVPAAVSAPTPDSGSAPEADTAPRQHRSSISYLEKELEGMDAVQEATERQEFEFEQPNPLLVARRNSALLMQRNSTRSSVGAPPSNDSRRPSMMEKRPSIAEKRPSIVGTGSARGSMTGSARGSFTGNPPVRRSSSYYRRMELSGIDAVQEASRRNQFDFAADGEATTEWH